MERTTTTKAKAGKRTARSKYSPEAQACIDRARSRVLPMSEEEMKRYSAAELQRLLPGEFSKFGYWYYSKDSDELRADLGVVVHDWKAVMR